MPIISPEEHPEQGQADLTSLTESVTLLSTLIGYQHHQSIKPVNQKLIKYWVLSAPPTFSPDTAQLLLTLESPLQAAPSKLPVISLVSDFHGALATLEYLKSAFAAPRLVFPVSRLQHWTSREPPLLSLRTCYIT